ncbi:tetraspanin-10 [Tamandua tetradactyla]|uniref:tetraspanin-10 n=1 Tax=Tamandua tetradactyla TaxID=48850 RepID=UPI004053FE42
MGYGERQPLLSQDTVGLQPPASVDSPPTSSPRDTAPRAGTWGCGCSPPGAPTLPAGTTCVQYLTFLTNIPCSLLGLLGLAAGLWGLAVKGSLGSGVGGPLPADLLLGLVLGGLAVSVVSLAGGLGALCGSACLLRCFSGSILAFLGLEALGAALLVALWGPLQDSLPHALREAIIHYEDNPDLRFLLDQVQWGLRCCGVASYQDWQLNLYFNCSAPGPQACSLPASCCINPWEDGASVNDQCSLGALGLGAAAAQRVVHLEGCGPLLGQWLHQNICAAGAYGILLVVAQGAELLLATWLLRALTVHKGSTEGSRVGGHLGVSTGAPAGASPSANAAQADSATFPRSPGSWDKGSSPRACPSLEGKDSE